MTDIVMMTLAVIGGAVVLGVACGAVFFALNWILVRHDRRIIRERFDRLGDL